MNNGMIKKFNNFDEMLEYMTKNNYPQNIINNIILIANKPENKPNNVKYIVLYDDMFEIEIYDNKCGIISYFLDLML